MGCRFEEYAPIVIGDGVEFGPEVALLTASHEIGGPGHRAGTPYVSPVRIGDGCWLGARVTVLPGVTIGRGCLVAAGAVVASDCAPDGLYAGVPARRVRDLPGSPS